jgi:hypothetical protein
MDKDIGKKVEDRKEMGRGFSEPARLPRKPVGGHFGGRNGNTALARPESRQRVSISILESKNAASELGHSQKVKKGNQY